MGTPEQHLVPSSPIALSVAPIPPAPSRVVVFVVGIENYQSRKTQMPSVDYAQNDAREFADAFRQLYAGCNVEIEVLIDEDATKARLEYEIQEIIRGLSEHELFIFYYAGHGYHDIQGNRITAWDSSPWNAETTLSVRDILLNPLRQSSCNKALLFIDACAVEIPNLIGSRDVVTNLDPSELRDFLGEARYCATFLSCSPGEKSYPTDEHKHGIWTYFLLRALRGEVHEALGPGLFLTDVGLRDYLKFQVPRYMRGSAIRKSQTPIAILNATNTFGILEVSQAQSMENGLRINDLPMERDLAAPRFTDIQGHAEPPRKNHIVTPRPAFLAFIHTSNLDSVYISTLTLTTDEPNILAKDIENTKIQLAHNILLDAPPISHKSKLSDFLTTPATQSKLLDWLSTVSFSAHLYFSPRTATTDEATWPPSRQTSDFFDFPIIHRISDKSIHIQRLISNQTEMESHLASACSYAQKKFHRKIVSPTIGSPRRNPEKSILELAELVFLCCEAYLENPTLQSARAVFAHIRTRLKYATNVATRERYTRENNPLP